MQEYYTKGALTITNANNPRNRSLVFELADSNDAGHEYQTKLRIDETSPELLEHLSTRISKLLDELRS